MQAWQSQSFLSSDSTAMDELQDFLRRRRQSAGPSDDCQQIEQELHRLFGLAEREALCALAGSELAHRLWHRRSGVQDLGQPALEVLGDALAAGGWTGDFDVSGLVPK